MLRRTRIWCCTAKRATAALQFSHAGKKEQLMSSSVTEPNRDEMARLLEAAGSAYNPKAVQALIEGVLAAPIEVGTGWHRLIADPMPQQLAECLEALRAASAAEHHDGLSGDDFARLPRSERLARLRKELVSRGLDGFIVPRADEHQGEY